MGLLHNGFPLQWFSLQVQRIKLPGLDCLPTTYYSTLRRGKHFKRWIQETYRFSLNTFFFLVCQSGPAVRMLWCTFQPLPQAFTSLSSDSGRLGENLPVELDGNEDDWEPGWEQSWERGWVIFTLKFSQSLIYSAWTLIKNKIGNIPETFTRGKFRNSCTDTGAH